MGSEPVNKQMSTSRLPADERNRLPAASGNGEEIDQLAEAGQAAELEPSVAQGVQEKALDLQLSKSLEIELDGSAGKKTHAALESSISILPAGSDDDSTTFEPPEHLLNIDWLEFEYKVASDALNAVLQEVRRLETRRDKKFIHSTRVAFRRWYAVWSILKKDGWQRPGAKKKGFKDLKRAYKLLGSVRDWDMTINLARKGSVPEPIVKRWLKERGEVRKFSNKRLAKLNLRKLVKKMKKFLDKRFEELRVEAIRNESLKPESAYKHIDTHLRRRETKSRDFADDAHTLPQLHALRLSVKSWRYILAEFYGVSSLLLVDTQQTLGQINDIDRFIQVIERELSTCAEKRLQATAVVQQQATFADVAQQLQNLANSQKASRATITKYSRTRLLQPTMTQSQICRRSSRRLSTAATA
jgi:Uncharacterized conserved protein